MLDKLFKRVKRKIKLKIVVSLALSFVFSFGTFFIADEFWMYAYLLLFPQDTKNIEDTYASYGGKIVRTSTKNRIKAGSNGTGQVGLSYMLASKMAAGYAKDYLQIVVDHSNGTAMQSTDFVGKGKTDALPYLILGTAIKETGVTYIDGDKTKPIPHSNISATKGNYGATIDGDVLSLYNTNTDWFLKHGMDGYAEEDASPTMGYGAEHNKTPFQLQGMICNPV